MGALVTLALAPDSPILDMPWIITFGPLTDDEDWEPVVCGPYEQPHAIALAEEVVADADLMAVVEPVVNATSVPEIRAEIADARATAAQSRVEVLDDGDDLGLVAPQPHDLSLADLDGEDLVAEAESAGDDAADELSPEAALDPDDLAFESEALTVAIDEPRHAPLPSPDEVRAGMARIAHRLTDES